MIKVISGLIDKKRVGKLKFFNLEKRWPTQDTTKHAITCHEKEEEGLIDPYPFQCKT